MNKYLEKIAKQLSEEEINSHGNKTYGKGLLGAAAGTAALLPGLPIVGDLYGRSHELAKMKSSITGEKVKPSSLMLHEGGKSYLRSLGRGALEGVGGAGVGAGVGSLISAIARKDPKIGLRIGGAIGGVLGGIHGQYASTKNSTRDYAEKWSKGDK